MAIRESWWGVKLPWRRDSDSSGDEAKRRLLESQLEAEYRLREAVQAAYLDVAKATIDRMLRRAENLGRSAAAIGTAYSAILGINYAADGPKLPAVALLPTALFAVSIFFVAINLGWITESQSVGKPLRWGISPIVQHKRLAEYIAWVNGTASGRAWALRTAIVSLALGVFSSPVAFIEINETFVAILSMAILGGWIVIEALWALARWCRSSKKESS